MPQKFAQVSYFEVKPNEAGQRLDNWLMARLKGAPRSLVYRIIRSGEVRVNKGRAKAGQRLGEGDSVRVPPLRLNESETAVLPAKSQQQVRDSVLYQDEEILVLNKPAGLAVHSGSGVRFGLIDLARACWGEDWQLVHRLDRETSGCILLVRSRQLQNEFQALLERGEVSKVYHCVVHGDWPVQLTCVDSPLQRVEHDGGERRVRGGEEGRRAISHFRVLKSLQQASLLQVRIETGRTHQIRVHTSEAGHPIVGDDKYGRRALDKALPLTGRPSLCLHAAWLKLELAGRQLSVEAPWPEPLAAVIRDLEIAA